MQRLCLLQSEARVGGETAKVSFLPASFTKNRRTTSKDFHDKNICERAFALTQMGSIRKEEGDYKNAVELFTRAAELGDINAHYMLSILYHVGKGVEKDEKKELHHLEEAAIGGQTAARSNLASVEGDRGREDRAMKHLIIAANLGFDRSLDALKNFFQMGLVSKEILAEALRAHHAAVDATKSPQREAAEAFYEGR